MLVDKVLSLSLKQLGDNIRRERISKKITQQQLAELADLNIRNVQRIEAGESDVLFSTLARIKKASGVSVGHSDTQELELTFRDSLAFTSNQKAGEFILRLYRLN